MSLYLNGSQLVLSSATNIASGFIGTVGADTLTIGYTGYITNFAWWSTSVVTNIAVPTEPIPYVGADFAIMTATGAIADDTGNTTVTTNGAVWYPLYPFSTSSPFSIQWFWYTGAGVVVPER